MRSASSAGDCSAVPSAGLGKRLEATLLLVEDNAPLRQMLSWELSDLGYQVSAAGDCAEARALMQRQSARCALIAGTELDAPFSASRLAGE